MNKRPFIYIAGPYRGKPGVNGDHMSNCHDACAVWNYFWENKVCAICPHWSFAQQFLRPREDLDWLAFTMAQMTLCSAVYRMPGESSGSDAEVRAAEELGIPVFRELGKAVSFMRGRDGKANCPAEGMDCGDCSGVCCPCVGAQAPPPQSQISTPACHNANACVWRFADCSGWGCPSGRHGPVDGPAV